MIIADYIGETTEYDKKEMLEEKRPKSWLKSVSAFANGSGGVLIFGVANDGTFVGLTDAKAVSEKISENIKARMDPIPQVVLELHEEDGMRFITLKVLAGQETPYYYVADGNRIAFVRVGNESVPADAATLKRLVLRGSGKTYDSLSSLYRLSDFAFTKLRSVYRARTGKELVGSDFSSFGLADENGMLTNAGALLADESPVRHSRLFCTRWFGLDKASGVMEALDDKEYSGSLVSLLLNGEEFVKNNTKKRWKKTGNGRIEMPDYPEQAVFEGIVNGLIHRDYMDTGSEVHIDIFDDRLEIFSPGGMCDGSIVQELDTDHVPSRRRNPVIADVFSRMHYMERRGSGFKKMKADYRNAVNYRQEVEPKFYSTSAAFFLTLYNLNYGTWTGAAVFDDGDPMFETEKATFETEKATFETEKATFEARIATINVKQPTREKMQVLFAKIGPDRTFGRVEIMEIWDISSYSAGQLINKLKAAGLVEPVTGQGKGRYRFIV